MILCEYCEILPPIVPKSSESTFMISVVVASRHSPLIIIIIINDSVNNTEVSLSSYFQTQMNLNCFKIAFYRKKLHTFY